MFNCYRTNLVFIVEIRIVRLFIFSNSERCRAKTEARSQIPRALVEAKSPCFHRTWCINQIKSKALHFPHYRITDMLQSPQFPHIQPGVPPRTRR